MKKYNVTVNGTAYEITLEVVDAANVQAAPVAAAPSAAPAPVAAPAVVSAPAPAANGETVNSPMPGSILSINVQNGSVVKKGDVLMILEAMKMENEITAPCDGTIASVNVQNGASVETGAVLCVIA